jgi:hypothetical protein
VTRANAVGLISHRTGSMISAGANTAPRSGDKAADLSKVPALQRLFALGRRCKECDRGIDRSDAFDAAPGGASRLKPVAGLIVLGRSRRNRREIEAYFRLTRVVSNRTLRRYRERATRAPTSALRKQPGSPFGERHSLICGRSPARSYSKSAFGDRD